MSERPYQPFYKPYGMTDEEYEYEKRIAAEKLAEWEQEQNESNLLDAQVSVICDKNGTEIKDGDIIHNEWDRDPYQQVKIIDGKFMFGKQGTTPDQEEGGWCEMLNNQYRFDLYWEIANSR